MPQPVRKQIQELHKDIIKEEPTLTLLVDGGSLLFSSMKEDTVNSKGEHVGGIHQFLLQLRMQLTQRVFNRIVVTFDDTYSGYKRWELYKPYKENRDKDYEAYGVSEYMKQYNERLKRMQNAIFSKNKKKEEKVVSSFEKFIDENFDRERGVLCQIFNELCIRWHMDEIVEGDDLIAYYCLHKKRNEKILIISSDMDLTQLLSDDIMIYNQKIKKYISNKNFREYFGYDYRNTLVKKIFCGDVSDNIGNIKGLSENKFAELMPEYKEREITIDEVKNKAKSLNEERIREKKKPLQLYDNIINGVSNKEYDGDFYVINEQIINLKKPLMTNDAIEEMEGILEAPLDMEDRSVKNLITLIYENGIDDLMGDTKFASFFAPFKRIQEKEQEFFEKETKI